MAKIEQKSTKLQQKITKLQRKRGNDKDKDNKNLSAVTLSNFT